MPISIISLTVFLTACTGMCFFSFMNFIISASVLGPISRTQFSTSGATAPLGGRDDAMAPGGIGLEVVTVGAGRVAVVGVVTIGVGVITTGVAVDTVLTGAGFGAGVTLAVGTAEAILLNCSSVFMYRDCRELLSGSRYPIETIGLNRSALSCSSLKSKLGPKLNFSSPLWSLMR